MIPFPGESVGCVDAWASDGRGYFLSNDIMLRGPYGTSLGHRVLASGDEFRCWAYYLDYHSYLEDTDTVPLEVGWVVEVLSGTGTLVVSDFHDDDWDESNTGDLPNALGTLNITGAGTYVMPTTSFSNAILAELGWDVGPAEVRLECTSGSIDVQQVKLRVWPVGGPLGAWSADTVSDSSTNIYPSVWTQAGNVDETVTFESQADARSALEIGTTGSLNVIFSGDGMGGLAFTALHTEYDPEIAGNIFDYAAAPSFTYLRVNPGNLAGPSGVDWVRPPEEVQDELDSILFQQEGPGTITWLQGTVSWLASSSASNGTTWWYASGSSHGSISEVSDFLASGTVLGTYVGAGAPLASMASPGAAAPAYVVESFEMPDLDPGQLYMINWWHDGFLGDVDEDWDGTFAGGSTTVEVFRGEWSAYPDGSPDLLRATWNPAAYRYWDPLGLPEPEFDDPVPAGYFLHPDPNADGLGDGVDVVFA